MTETDISAKKVWNDATGNEMTFFQAMQLFVASLKDETYDTSDAYNDIEDEEVHNLFGIRDLLPPSIRHFVLLQDEISDRDTGYILRMILPDALEERYAVSGRRLKETKSEKARRELIQRFLKALGDFLRRLFEVYANLQDLVSDIEDAQREIEQAIETLNPKDAEKFRPAQKRLEELKTEVKKQKEQLKQKTMPEPETLEEISANVEAKRADLKVVEMEFTSRFQKLARVARNLGRNVLAYGTALIPDRHDPDSPQNTEKDEEGESETEDEPPSPPEHD
jgi:hypothetical protein